MRLEGKVAIVTGGARGIGFARAQRFAREGAKVVIADLLREEGQAAAAAILSAGGAALFVEVDVSVEDKVAGLVDDTFGQFDRINILVNNAGVLDPRNTTVTDLRRDDWDRVLAVNLTGAFLCAKHVLPTMVEQKSGSIVVIASIDASTGYSKPHAQVAYAASKGGLLALTKSLAGSYGGSGIRCNAICPGPARDGDESRRSRDGSRAREAPGEDSGWTVYAARRCGRTGSFPRLRRIVPGHRLLDCPRWWCHGVFVLSATTDVACPRGLARTTRGAVQTEWPIVV
jgi:NAD(P)-dependent dehydrogenase (short-subunit alcohol dehydrogenase family)